MGAAEKDESIIAEIEKQLPDLEKRLRTSELGRMLSGQQVTPEALRHAARLMKAGAER